MHLQYNIMIKVHNVKEVGFVFELSSRSLFYLLYFAQII